MIDAIKKPLIRKSDSFEAKIFMCDACCCGDPRFASTRAPMETLQNALLDSLEQAGQSAKQCPVAITGCMGPCEIGNNVILATKTQNFFFQKMNQPADLAQLGQFVKTLNQDPKARVSGDLARHLSGRELL